jgi:hypothetical protein
MCRPGDFDERLEPPPPGHAVHRHDDPVTMHVNATPGLNITER